MTFAAILDHVVEHTKHEPYRRLTAEGATNWEGYRRLVLERYEHLTNPLPDITDHLTEAPRGPHLGCCGQVIPKAT